MGIATNSSEIGIRELRDHLSAYLKRVKAGEELVVTEHGAPVAWLVPRPRSNWLAELIATGKATPPRTRQRSVPKPIKVTRSVSELVSEQRE